MRAHRPVRRLGFTLDELGPGAPADPPATMSRAGKVLSLLDTVLRRYERRPLRPLRTAALRVAEAWVVQRQEADGGWGGIQPPWVYSLMALHLQGYPLEHPVIQAGLAGLEAFTVKEDGHVWLEACQSPLWDTMLALQALADAGVAPDDAALIRAADWLLDRQVTEVAGDWAVRRPALAPGGWSFEYANVNYPDIDDTAVCALALRCVAHPDVSRLSHALDRGR